MTVCKKDYLISDFCILWSCVGIMEALLPHFLFRVPNRARVKRDTESRLFAAQRCTYFDYSDITKNIISLTELGRIVAVRLFGM
jgi:hypothetical protein